MPTRGEIPHKKNIFVNRLVGIKPVSLILYIVAIFLVVIGYWAANPLPASRSAAQYAQEIYIPIACTGPHLGFKNIIGTGFPVSRNVVVTAGHIDCGPTDITEVSHDGGWTWEWIPRERMLVHENLDIRIYKVAHNYTQYATFRTAVFGENVYGHGTALGTIGTFGHVIRVDDTSVVSDNIVAGGMSGSALVADDSKVVGLTVQAISGRVAGFPTVYVTHAIAGNIISSVLPAMIEALSGVPVRAQPPQYIIDPNNVFQLPRTVEWDPQQINQ